MNIWTAQSRLQRDQRQGFTLVELLVVISIITLIASMTLFTLYGVREDTKERRARSQVARIHELIMQQYESYRTRAVPVAGAPLPLLDPGWSQMNTPLRRLVAVRQLMRMELPDRKTDLIAPASSLLSESSLWRTYRRRAIRQSATNDLSGWTPLHEQAECLFLILASIRDGDTTGLDFFTESEIGDVDDDGMPEILDPWGVPIYFLRWAPGFRSDLQPGDTELTTDGNAGLGNGDPFDPLKLDPLWRDNVAENDPFLLYPVIISAGRDKQFDMVFFFSDPDRNNPRYVPRYGTPTNQPIPLFVYEDPYAIDPDDPSLPQIGSTTGSGYADNITNHFLEVR